MYGLTFDMRMAWRSDASEPHATRRRHPPARVNRRERLDPPRYLVTVVDSGAPLELGSECLFMAQVQGGSLSRRRKTSGRSAINQESRVANDYEGDARVFWAEVSAARADVSAARR